MIKRITVIIFILLLVVTNTVPTNAAFLPDKEMVGFKLIYIGNLYEAFLDDRLNQVNTKEKLNLTNYRKRMLFFKSIEINTNDIQIAELNNLLNLAIDKNIELYDVIEMEYNGQAKLWQVQKAQEEAVDIFLNDVRSAAKKAGIIKE